ncbi:hypothetical protein Q7P37_009637 [Cladosporium fusiforme]
MATVTEPSGLPSYSAATSDGSRCVTVHNEYADFTIGELRTQILANASIFKPAFLTEKGRSEYDLELVLIKGRNGQHCTMILRRNTTQKKDEDWNHRKIILDGVACDTPRQAYELMLLKTEEILRSMLEPRGDLPPQISKAQPREMGYFNPDG